MAEPKRINLALQGGGAHGAFTWGVLDRLLEEDGIEIAAISGTSAGALNGAAVKSGMITGGRQGARDNLDHLWSKVGAVTNDAMAAWISALSPPSAVLANTIQSSPAYQAMDIAMRFLTPYTSPFPMENPLRRIVERFNYDTVCAVSGPDLYICATNVRTGKIRVFHGEEISPDVILASACLPTLFRAVEIDDQRTGEREAYWDGGYTGNPALFPLYLPHLPDDLIVVNINPLHREDVPRDAQAIQNRINEISFNSSLLRELRAINFVKRLIEDGKIQEGQMKKVLVHMIADDGLMNELSVATKLVPNPAVLARLKTAGRVAADAFLNASFDDIGKRDSVDLRVMFD
ncbi:patatin-like phospholipase family protein [Aestuariibius sp. 2305UL40-4]|uniref:patatin-like phospholipase family protein n=1 Tax=Aestuariibius violaceus TaxID=3234132 RepID=UPI00345E861A